MRLPRRVLIVCAGLLTGLAVLAIAVSAWLALWMPTRGRAWLESRLEEQLRLDVTIGALRYSLWDGFVIDGIAVTDPNTSSTWLHATRVKARISPLPLILQQRALFRIDGTLIVPCDTAVTVSGSYGLRTHDLKASLTTAEFAVAQIGAPLARSIPPALRSGFIRLFWQIAWAPGRVAMFSGSTEGRQLVWEQAPIRLTADLTVEGTVTPSAQPAQPPSLDFTGTLARGHLEGLPTIGEATNVHGTLRLANDVLTIASLQGTSLGSAWQLEGAIEQLQRPVAEVRLRTPIDLAALAARLPDDIRRWEPVGAADLVAVFRGPLNQWPANELMADVLLRDASLAVPPLGDRLKHLSGGLYYDHLSQRVELTGLEGRIGNNVIGLDGAIRVGAPAAINLAVQAHADLGLFSPLLPTDGPITSLLGPVEARAIVTGTTARPAWDGTVLLSAATVGVRGLPHPIDRISGTVQLSDRRAATSQLTMVVEQEPVTLVGAITDYATRPAIEATIRIGPHTAMIVGTQEADHWTIDDGQLAVGNSRLRVHGQVARQRRDASRLSAQGLITLEDLSQLPWIDAGALAAWDLHGEAHVQMRVTGRLDEWRNAALAGAIRADRLTAKGLPIQQLAAEFEQRQRTIQVRVLDAFVAGGRCSGTWSTSYTDPAPTILEFDLTRADLALLTAPIPALKERYIRGDVSAHASLMGAWKDPTRLRGDGWVHATGDHLAELPLLDKFLRGFFDALGERLGLGLGGLRTAQITEISGRGTLAAGRVQSDDFRLSGTAAGEPIAIDLKGSVGLDKTLDLIVEPDLSERLVLESPNTSSMAGALLKTVGRVEQIRRLVGRHHLGGTIDHPQAKFEFSLDQLVNQAMPFGLNRLLGPLQDTR